MTYPFLYALTTRAQLVGRVEHADDRLKPACAPRTPIDATVTATISYELDKAALAFRVVAPSPASMQVAELGCVLLVPVY